jgi:hypothetical protein
VDAQPPGLYLPVLAGGCTTAGRRLARWWMVIGPPFLV